MKRRNFIYLTGVGAAAAMLPAIPVFGKEISPSRP
ncbi:twin-arginine translocation signal domain-containing protein [Pedobacter sp. P26]